jgi:hypothetical protein
LHGSYQRTGDTVLAQLGFDEKILKEDYRPVPPGDDTAAARRHAYNRLGVFGFGQEGGKAGLRAKAVAQEVGRGRAYGVQQIFSHANARLSCISATMSAGFAARTRNGRIGRGPLRW